MARFIFLECGARHDYGTEIVLMVCLISNYVVIMMMIVSPSTMLVVPEAGSSKFQVAKPSFLKKKLFQFWMFWISAHMLCYFL
jgi:hypothetical protein